MHILNQQVMTSQHTASLAAPAERAAPAILVVDDRAEVSRAIADLCRALGAVAIVSQQGETVHHMLRQHRPSGIIVDIMMPEEDGFEALKEIAAYDRALPVLLITGHGETWLRMGATLGRAHGLDVIRTSGKPVRAEVLAEFISIARNFATRHPY